MCFSVKKFKNKELAKEYKKTMKPKVAVRDITVYKILQKNILSKTDFQSPFRNESYELGKIKKVKTFTKDIIVENRISKNGNTLERSYEIVIFKGLHSWKNKRPISKAIQRSNMCPFKEILVEMFIPKGSRYFSNSTQYVSNQLEWRKPTKK